MDPESTPINDAGDDDVSMDSDDVSTPESEEFTGFNGSDSSETLDPNSNVNDALAALLESNRMMQAALAKKSRKIQKVYVLMSDKFDGKIDDFIDI